MSTVYRDKLDFTSICVSDIDMVKFDYWAENIMIYFEREEMCNFETKYKRFY